jgi:hypothetical protein
MIGITHDIKYKLLEFVALLVSSAGEFPPSCRENKQLTDSSTESAENGARKEVSWLMLQTPGKGFA